jgi:hypothetical protein
MLDIVTFERVHLALLSVQSAQLAGIDQFKDSPIEAFGQAWTAIENGVPIACAGIVQIWPGRGYAWALLSEQAGRWMLQITRAVRRAMALSGLRRIEMAVDSVFEAGARWALLLGCVLETPQPMRGYLPDGRDAYLFSKVT